MRLRFSEIALISAIILLFLIGNRAAYQGYFSDDDLDNIANTTLAGFDTFWKGFGSVRYDIYNFRPVGHVFFRWMAQTWGLQFTPYVLLIQSIHVFNSLLIYFLVRRELGRRAAMVSAVCFMFHPALIAVHWKPMYVFDLLCGTALIGSYCCYRRGWWIASLLLFWCAYKAKEVALFFPVVLLLDELAGDQQWRRLIPFGCVSLTFGIQALLANRGRGESAYTLRFTFTALWECLVFYGTRAFGIPWIWLAGSVWMRENERRWVFRMAIGAIFLMGPLLFLPGRLFAVYLYIPLVLGAIATGAALCRLPSALLALSLVVFLGVGLRELRAFRKAELTQAMATKEFVESACKVLKGKGDIQEAVYEGGPIGLNEWGIVGALRLCSGNLALPLRPWRIDTLRSQDTVFRWTKMPSSRGFLELLSYDGSLSGDWYAWEESFRWLGGRGSAAIAVSPGASTLELDVVTVPADHVELWLNGTFVKDHKVTFHGEQKIAFPVPNIQQGTALIELRVRPTKQIGTDPRALGIALRSIRTLP